MQESKFKVKKITSIKDIESGKVTELPESDLCIQAEKHILQFKLEETKKVRKK